MTAFIKENIFNDLSIIQTDRCLPRNEFREKVTRKFPRPLVFPCSTPHHHGVTDVNTSLKHATHRQKRKLEATLESNVSAREDVAEFNQSKVCGEKSSTSQYFAVIYLPSNKKPR